jgi:NHL repeat
MRRLTTVAITAVAVAGLTGLAGAQEADEDLEAKSHGIPEFEVDPSWPKELPDNWLIGQVGGIAVDRHDNIWILQRARTLTDDEAGATEAYVDPETGETATNEEGEPIDALGNPRPFGPIADCCLPAPAVMQFDPEGNLLQAWGGPADEDFIGGSCKEEEGCVWPAGEHGIYVDHNDNVYIAGNGSGEGGFPWAGTHGDDSHVLKFSNDGTFLLRVGQPGHVGPSSNDTDGADNGTPLLWNPADIEVDPETNELYIADGYGNHRVVVVDADTGEYQRHWGAYGQNPVDDAAAEAVGEYAEDRDAGVTPAQFRNPVHCVRIAEDGLIYVCDRSNNRMQVFDKDEVGAECSNPDGQEGACGFVTEATIRPDTLSSGSVWDLDTSSDRAQSCLHNVDGTNQNADTIARETLEILETWGHNGRNAGQFHWVHNVATDSEGNLYTAEVDTGKRAQKFEREGSKGCIGKG